MNELWGCFHIVTTDIHEINSYQRFNGKPLMLLIQRFLLETLIRVPWFITTLTHQSQRVTFVLNQ